MIIPPYSLIHLEYASYLLFSCSGDFEENKEKRKPVNKAEEPFKGTVA
jgi:hypothetical protein